MNNNYIMFMVKNDDFLRYRKNHSFLLILKRFFCVWDMVFRFLNLGVQVIILQASSE